MLNAWSLSIPRRANDPPDHLLILLDLEFMSSEHGNCVLPHQTAHPAMPDTHLQLVQLFRHPGSAIAAQTGSVLVPDMRKQHHVPPLGMSRGPMLPSMESALGNAHQAAKMAAGQRAAILGNIPKLHDF